MDELLSDLCWTSLVGLSRQVLHMKGHESRGNYSDNSPD